MALIGTIRKNGWILIVMMVLALGGFILMDVVTNSQRYSAADLNTVGKVNGEDIKRDEFDNYEKLVYTNSTSNPYQVRNQIWNYFVEKVLISQEAEEIGLGVGKDELLDLEFGNNISSIIAERFKDSNGQLNRATLASIKAAIEGGQFTDPTNRAYWAVQEDEIIKQRLEEKIVGMIGKAFYTPKWQAEMAFRDNNERLDALVVRIPFDKATGDIQLTDADYKEFLASHKGVYDRQEETRVINYITFGVKATQADTMASRQVVASLIEDFKKAENDSVFVVGHNGVADGSYDKKDALPAAMADSLMSLPYNTVVGPILDNGIWVVAKILDRKVIADSVQARHILIRGDIAGAEQKIDSLKNLLETGQARFDSLAVNNSMDQPSAVKGGDLGWFAEGRMVPEFNRVCFYTGVKGTYYKVASQFGWHLLEITGTKYINNVASVKAAYLSQRVEPSVATQDNVRKIAEGIMQDAKTIEDMERIAGEKGLAFETSAALKANDFRIGTLPEGDATRSIVRWAFNEETEVGASGKELFTFRDPAGGYFDAFYLLPGLKSVVPAGEATVESIKADQAASKAALDYKKARLLLLRSKMQTT
ncbi:MAG: peptidylprolyl isomerase [Saprospiraceae bacterium]